MTILVDAPPRVAVATASGPVDVPLPHGVQAVRAPWPFTGTAIDVGIYVGAPTARVRARAQAGPMLILFAKDSHEATIAELLEAPESQAAMLQARDRLLAARIRAEQARRGLLTSMECQAADASPEEAGAAESPRKRHKAAVCVISPDAAAREAMLARPHTGCEIVELQAADVVIAVPPHGGWKSRDVPKLNEAFGVVGRMVTTAAIPGVPAFVAAPQQIFAAARTLALSPPRAVVPAANPGQWLAAATRLERAALARARRRISEEARQLRQRCAARPGRAVQLVEDRSRELGLSPLVELRPPPQFLAVSMLVELLAVVAFARVMPLWMAIVAGMLMLGVRWWTSYRSRVKAWAATLAAQVEQHWVSQLDTTSVQSAGAVWIRRALARTEKQTSQGRGVP